jgi:hypothetical protein
MARGPLLLLAVILLGCGAAGAAPGGRFEQRLKTAETRLRPKPRSARRAVLRRPAAAQRVRVRAAGARVPRRKVLRRSSARLVRVASRAVNRPLQAIQAAERGTVTFVVTPRRSESMSHELTGDLVLFADGRGTAVDYRWDGGAKTTRSTVVLKGLMPQSMRVAASAQGRGGAGWSWVPVKANCITTVRFTLPR